MEGKHERRHSVQLFALTLASVYFTYAYSWAGGNPLLDYRVAWESAQFSGALMVILLIHEMAHYFVARRHGFSLSLPYFIPFPLGIGTLGALIHLRSPPRSRTALLEMGAAGPLGGAVVAFSMLALGLPFTEPPVAAEPGVAYLIFHDPLIVRVLGTALLGAPPDRYALFHPVALAGWFGCLLTAINLLPIGQLDGGHILHALTPRWGRAISRVVLAVLVGSGLLLLIWYGGQRWWEIRGEGSVWWVATDSLLTDLSHMGLGLWGVVLLVLGVGRGQTVQREPPVTRRAWLLALAAMGVFVLTFLPFPFDTETPVPAPDVEQGGNTDPAFQAPLPGGEEEAGIE